MTFDLGASEAVNLSLYDGTGRLVESRSVMGSAGRNQAEFGGLLPQGIYFYRFESTSLEQTGKVAVLR